MFQTKQTNKLAIFDDLFLWNIPKCHAKQATLHTAYHRTAGSYPGSGKKIMFFPPNWVSTKVGTEIVCRYNAPKNLNSQHTPQFGQPKHAPETSQLCPLMPLNSSSKQTKATRILRLHVYITKFLSKSQIFASSLLLNS